MIDTDKWQEIFNTIRKNKLRTFLTSLGVFWGIFMLVFLLGMGSGLENGVFKDFGHKAKNIMYVSAWKTSLPYKGFPAGRRIRLKLDDLEKVKESIPEVDKMAPRREPGDMIINYGTEKGTYNTRGELTELIHIEALVLREGRYINQKDIDENRKVTVLGEKIKEELFGEEECIDKHVNIRGIDFKVVGVFGPIEIKEWTQSDTESAVIPLTTMYRTFDPSERVDWFVCSAKPGVKVSNMEERVRARIKEIHNVDPEDPQAVHGFNLEEEYGQITGLFLGIKIFLWFVGIGTLLAGVVGVSNIMLIIVKERTKEIGIRKALGATPGSIINMILTESVFITAFSGYLGLLFATLIIGGVSALMKANNVDVPNFYNPEVNLWAGVGALVMLVVSGIIAGLIPSLQAARINPVIALKDE